MSSIGLHEVNLPNKLWITALSSTLYPQHAKPRHSIHICRLPLRFDDATHHSGIMNIAAPTTARSGSDAVTDFQQPMLASPDPQAASSLDRIAAMMGSRDLAPKQFGALGEQYAAAWLERQGWTILSRNWRTRYGELDIVMLDVTRTVVFVEVKSRRSTNYGQPQEAVTASRQQNLRKAASDWLLDRRNRVPHIGIRFDVVTIVMHMGRPTVHHIASAF